MKSKSLYLILLGCALISSCSSDPINQSSRIEERSDIGSVTDEELDLITDAEKHETSLARKLREARGKPNRISALSVIKSVTRYDADFVPTVYIELENTTETTIVAFELRSEELNSTKMYKANIEPSSTYSTSFKVADVKNVSGDIVYSVNRFIYTDGTIVEASMR